jgi:uncharacterized Tic20 family protein
MTSSNPASTHSPEDQLLAALAHLSALVPMTGLFIPIVIWVIQRNKSPYLAFQSLQAAIFQLLSLILLFLSYICQFSSILPTFLSFPFQGGNSPLGGIMVIILGGLSLIINLISAVGCLVYLSTFIYAITAAVLVFKGRDFRYIIIAHQLEKFLQKDKVSGQTTPNG